MQSSQVPKQASQDLQEALQKQYARPFVSWRLRARAWRKRALWKAVITSSFGVKRFMDILGAGLALLLLSPLLLVVGLAILVEDGRPIFFSQERIGAHGKPFRIYKLRSMRIDAEEKRASLQGYNESSDGVIFKMRDDPRITRIGRFIRKASIDELPQLWNVMCGDMSLVGPRPALPSEVEQYSLEERQRIMIKPGITCFWQVSGRSTLSFSEQVQLDVEYIQSQSFWLDMRLLMKTIPAVILARGAY